MNEVLSTAFKTEPKAYSLYTYSYKYLYSDAIAFFHGRYDDNL